VAVAVPPAEAHGRVDTGWHMFSAAHRAGMRHPRPSSQQWLEAPCVDTRMVWTGNAARQPAIPRRAGTAPRPVVQRGPVMEWGLVLPNNHSMSDDDTAYIGECLDSFVTTKGLG